MSVRSDPAQIRQLRAEFAVGVQQIADVLRATNHDLAVTRNRLRILAEHACSCGGQFREVCAQRRARLMTDPPGSDPDDYAV